MDLPPDKAKVLKQYDDEKKWDIICDQVSTFFCKTVYQYLSRQYCNLRNAGDVVFPGIKNVRALILVQFVNSYENDDLYNNCSIRRQGLTSREEPLPREG